MGPLVHPTPQPVLEAWGVKEVQELEEWNSSRGEDWEWRYSKKALEETYKRKDGRDWDRSVGTNLLDNEKEWEIVVGIKEMMEGKYPSVIFRPATPALKKA